MNVICNLNQQVLMFLTACNPVSEKSAVNLIGKLNEANLTNFETSASAFQESFEKEVSGHHAVLI